MNVNDIDLDISNLLKKVPKDHVVLYIRAGEGGQDCLILDGDMDALSGTIAQVMNQYDDVAEVLVNAVLEYQE
jgi:hypothetical protein